ncbi:hypothetical protein [Kitasatospora sp. GAS204B]|uniref:hypothetical protein n=1 Tax=unclassified Kitasatospora TaxID=2633591 RepID=UPI0024739F8F|nr:hypothetical protein [Kitasatospora sp. GAS204B]MDH6118530.1 hypothetical protein [Kitasatospora sp. GAS204B]
MNTRGIKRITALAFAGAALAGGLGLAAAGSASATSGGGCGGPAWEQGCVSATASGAVNSDAYTNLQSNACSVDVILWDYTTNTHWDNWFACGSGYTHYQGTLLPNPSSGHDYKSELRVYWNNGSGYDYQTSPDLIY